MTLNNTDQVNFMTQLTKTDIWQQLSRHYNDIHDQPMRDMFAADPQRFDRFSVSINDILFDYSKNRITSETVRLLCELAEESNLAAWRERMFRGDKINNTEKRAVLHTALRNRSDEPVFVDGKDVMPEIRQVIENMRVFSEKIRSGEWKGYTGKPITNIVNIGIGGSDLGPKMVYQALTAYRDKKLNVQF